MSAPVINKSPGYKYIENLTSKQASEVKNINGMKFVECLQEFYGKDISFNTVNRLLTMRDDSFSGVKDFKSRFLNALVPDAKTLSGADQQYIANKAHRTALKSFVK